MGQQLLMSINGVVLFLLELPRFVKRTLVISIDVSLCIITFWMAICLHLDEWSPLGTGQWVGALVSASIAVPIFIIFGLYRAIFRYVSVSALLAIFEAVACYSVFFGAVILFVAFSEIPRLIVIIQPLLLLVSVSVTRIMARRYLGDAYQKLLLRPNRARVLIYGAGAAGRTVSSALNNNPQIQVVGFIDDNVLLHGCLLQGVCVYGPAEIRDLVKRMEINQVLLAIPSVGRARRNEIIKMICDVGVKVSTLPSLSDIANGLINVSDIRDIHELDLLGRDTIPPNSQLMGLKIVGQTVLVTGAGGSIGSELCRQIMNHNPAVLILLDQSEFALYTVNLELIRKRDYCPDITTKVVPLLASVCDEQRISQILSRWKPDTVYHAAAYKHVPIVEDNVAEGIKNNIFGTLTISRLCSAAGTRDFVLVSSDKAVRPTNVMGATKRVSELILQAIASKTSNETCFSMVRFGNVLGSSGSVVPLFKQQIKDGGPITLTHPDVTRYFMTIPEAAELVIQASAMAKGGDVFILDMGEPVRIIELARRMIELSGLKVADDVHPDGDIAIEIVGLRPGEKLYEELLIGENPRLTSHPKIWKASELFIDYDTIISKLENIRLLLTCETDSAVYVRELRSIIPEYYPDLNLGSNAA